MVVVVVEEFFEVETESCDGGFFVGDEGGFPAFLKDGVLDLFDFAVGLGSTGVNEPVLDPEFGEGFTEAVVDEFVAPVGSGSLELPSPVGQVRGDLVGEGGGVDPGGIVSGGMELSPREGGRYVNGGVLPHHSGGFSDSEACFFEPTQLETVKLHQITWLISLERPDPWLRPFWWRGSEFGFGEPPGDSQKPITEPTGVELVSFEDAPHLGSGPGVDSALVEFIKEPLRTPWWIG